MSTLREHCRNTTGSISDQFVGVRFFENNFQVTFPYGYEIPNDDFDCKNSIEMLLTSFVLANDMFINDSVIQSNGFSEGILPFFSFFWLIKDFVENGIFAETIRTKKNNQPGKIDWKKTLSGDSLYVNGRVFFPKIVVSQNDFVQSVITLIHTCCLQCSYKYIGFLYPNLSFPDSHFIITENNVDFCLSVLDREESRTCTDRNKLLIKHCKKIILSDKRNNIHHGILSLGVSSFEYVWEGLVRSLFGNLAENEYYPNTSWHILDRNIYHNSHLRPDSIMEFRKCLFVLDAKYYYFGVDDDYKRLPNTSSIQKQLTYASHASEVRNDIEDVFNVFLLPYNKSNNSFNKGESVEIIGYAKSSWNVQNLKDQSFSNVFLALVDTKTLIEEFVLRRIDMREKLFEVVIVANEQLKNRFYIS